MRTIRSNAQHQGIYLAQGKSASQTVHQKPDSITDKFIHIHCIFRVLQVNVLKNSSELDISEWKMAFSLLIVAPVTQKCRKTPSIVLLVIPQMSSNYLQGNLGKKMESTETWK